jgi:hypothetical protein
METLMKLPCAQPFLHPFEPPADDLASYNALIKHPIDLPTILKRLMNNEYPGISHWDRDMSFIWTNAEKWRGKSAWPWRASLANELHRHYDKEYERVKLLRLAKWSRVVFAFRTKLEALFDTIPPFVGAMAHCSDRVNASLLKPFSEEELNVFIRMSLYLVNLPDSKKMARIIQHFQPEFEISDKPLEIDVNDLSVQSLHALRAYITYRLAEMNILYPK